MAYIDQELKAELSPSIKSACKKYGIKCTIGVRHHSTLVVNIIQGKLDFIQNYNNTMEDKPYSENWKPVEIYIDVNPYGYQQHFTGQCLDFLTELFAAINQKNWDKSDIQTDYFNVGYYVNVNIGNYNKPYILL